MKEQPTNFRSAEESRLTQPAWLYRIVSGANSYFMTGYDKPVIIEDGPAPLMDDPQTFNAVPIEHQPPKEAADFNSEPTVVSLPANDTLLRRYFLTTPNAQVEIHIWRINSASLPGPISFADLYLEFTGVCQSVSFAGYQIDAAFISRVQQEDKTVPNYFFQKLCNHTLGNRFCGVDLSNFKLETTLFSADRFSKSVLISDATMNIDSPPRSIAISEETFQGGQLVDALGNRIGIIACEVLESGKRRLWLNYWAATLQASAAVTLYLGCLKIVRVCDSTFDNLPNFGGMPYVPITNPATNSIVT